MSHVTCVTLHGGCDASHTVRGSEMGSRRTRLVTQLDERFNRPERLPHTEPEKPDLGILAHLGPMNLLITE